MDAARADLLVYGNAERQISEIAHRLASGQSIRDIQDLRGTAFVRRGTPAGWIEIESTTVDTPGRIDPHVDPYAMAAGRRGGPPQTAAARMAAGDATRSSEPGAGATTPRVSVVKFYRKLPNADRSRSVVRMPSCEQVAADPVLYARASRILHMESNPGNARALVQRHGDVDVWLNPPPIPLTTREMDGVYELPYRRVPHPSYGEAKIPAYEMIRFSVAIQRGCFGGCTFCSITEHEGRIIQSRSEDSVIRFISSRTRAYGAANAGSRPASGNSTSRSNASRSSV